jgi:hypothetical protein
MSKMKLGMAAIVAALALGVVACTPAADTAQEPATVEEAVGAAADDAGAAAAAAGDAVEGAVHDGAEAVAAATDDQPAKAEEPAH